MLCATITPFHGADLALDHIGVTSNAMRLVQQGVQVFVVNGTIGEAGSLTRSERALAVSATARGMAGRGLLIAGCAGADAAEVANLGDEAAASGAHALLIPPARVSMRPDECVDFFAAVDNDVTRPFIVYNNPLTGGTDIDLNALDRISRLENFLALKEASPDVVRFAEIVNRFGSRFPVIAAAEYPLLFTLVAGASACMTASAAFAPGLLRELFDAVTRGDLDVARALYARIRAFRRLFAGRQGPAYLPFTKAAVELCGGRAGAPRPPLEAITDAERSELERVLKEDMMLNLPAR